MARSDADRLARQIAAYAVYNKNGGGGRTDNLSEDFKEIFDSPRDDPEKALSYLALASSQSADADFLRLIGCSILEDILQNPRPEILQRVVAEARKSARFR